MMWSMAFRFKPHLDMQMLANWRQGHGPRDIVRGEDSALLDQCACSSTTCAPISLPKREYMEHAKMLGEGTGLAASCKPEAPWFGYSLGAWTEELDREAERAVERRLLGDRPRSPRQRRRKDVKMNTEVRFASDSDEGEV